MDELAVRVTIVALLAGVVVVLGLAGRRPPRLGTIAGLGVGVTAFTSAACDQCPPAREVLDRVLGKGGWVEVRLEERRELFARAGIAQVPVVVVTRLDGRQDARAGVPSARWLRHARSMLEPRGTSP